MYSYESSDDCASIAQMNSDLRQAQIELLSAHCVAHQLRVHYSAEDLARFGRRDVLRKSAEAASALNEFYSAIQEKISSPAESSEPVVADAQIDQAVQWVSGYLRQQRERYFAGAQPLSNSNKARMWPYFSARLLDELRFVELRGERVPMPEFYAQARALGFDNLPQITHMDSLTFIDVIVFNQELTERALFHALAHAAQFRILGVARYCELFVHSFVKTKTHFSVPLEAHAFSMESKFLRSPAERFSVEDQVLCWANEGRY